MLKKIFKAGTVFTLLVGCYFAYAQVFGLVVGQLTTVRSQVIVLQHRDSRSKLDSINRAKAVMPPGHWATKSDLNFRYYNAERGYWMYAQDLQQVTEENGVRYDGKRIRLSPFLAISASHDGKKIYVITADRAVIDLNQPLGFGSGPDGETLKVKHIRLEPNVEICDNKGTPNDLTDDMKIGPLRDLEYDDATSQISTESHVVIVDPDMITSGDGMIVQLRQGDAPHPGASSGFGGAERLELLKNVEVVLHDVGNSGVFPGMKQPVNPANGAVEAKIEVAAAPGQNAKPELQQGPTPLHVTCKSKMVVLLPKPALAVATGPPAPPAPTIVQFDRDVVVLRGQVDEQPGQLMCDSLKLTLVPGEAVSDQADAGEKGGLFGSLALQCAHATGYAVWLYLPADGIKLRCNELIHMHLAPYKPNWTYFRADLTRKLWLEKIDLVQEVGSPDRGKIKSVTHIWTVDATMYDKGNGFDSADVVANGPGRLETRPDRGQAAERIAIWQDKLELQNELAPDGKVKQKIIVLTGKRPCIDDRARSASIDSAKSIKVLLVPKTAQAVQDASVGGGSFDIKRVLAFRDVHLLAPAKTMTARDWLDADFVQVGPTPSTIDDALSAPPAIAAAPAANTEDVSGEAPSNLTPADGQLAAKEGPSKKPDEPPMVGSAERMWVKVEMKPKAPAPPATGNQAEQTKTASTSKSKTGSQDGDLGDKTSEIREAWLWGSVALHQDPAKGKTVGQEASGEALYLDNQGEGKAITWIYQRDPNETTYLPGPLPPARVANDDKIITGAGFIAMNQRTDQAWVSGPGTLTQFTTRSAGSPADSLGAAPRTASASPSRTTAAPRAAEPHATSMLAQNDVKSSPAGQSSESKPTTRAGRPLSEKVTSTIWFSEGMEFNGRSVDPAGHPSGRTDFLGIVTAQLEDSLLYCEERMIAYTDRIVPLAKLGALSKSSSADSGKAGAQSGEGKDADDQPQLALIECYKNAVGISRKVHASVAAVLQRQEIQADELLVYERLTGEFHVPGRGKVFLYDRSEKSGGPGSDRDAAARPATAERPVTPASSRASTGTTRSSTAGKAKGRATSRSQPLQASADSRTSKLPPLVLTQIHFLKGMRGRLGSTNERSQLEPNWYNFFGDIELGRAKVEAATSRLDFDKLPPDGMFLTGQTLSVRTEPPPVGSPPSTPARDYVQAWENAYVSSNDKSLQADVITYDSDKDLIYAYGQGGRGVLYAEQYATGQPSTSGAARAVQLYPKTGAAHFIDNTSVQLVDKNSGARPTAAMPTDPDFKKKKPPKKGFRISPGSVERRGFTGQ